MTFNILFFVFLCECCLWFLKLKYKIALLAGFHSLRADSTVIAEE